MSERWYIFKDERKIGPLSPGDIRRGLREGEFDPFDLVSREGSNLRRELVEVDELFFTSQSVYGDEVVPSEVFAANTVKLADIEALGPGFHVPTTDELLAIDAQRTTHELQTRSPLFGQGHLALASDLSTPVPTLARHPYTPQVVRRQRDPKHFLLMNGSGRILGPMSATEVQSLYFRGVVGAEVKVMRQGSEASVPLGRFISVMSGSRSPKAQVQGAHPVSGIAALRAPRGRPMIYSSSTFGLPPLAAMALVAAFTLFLATGLLLIEHKTGKLSALADKFSPFESKTEEKPHRLRARSNGRPALAAPSGSVSSVPREPPVATKASKQSPVAAKSSTQPPVAAKSSTQLPAPLQGIGGAQPLQPPQALPKPSPADVQAAIQAAFVAEDAAPATIAPAALAPVKVLRRPAAKSQYKPRNKGYRPAPKGKFKARPRGQ